jgi:hypothetical protein
MALKKEDWHSRPRAERLANVLYPHLAPPETQREMVNLAAVENKRGGLERRIEQGQRAYGVQPKPKPSAGAVDYSRVPGLRRR